jgi:glutamyl-tRNA reductase
MGLTSQRVREIIAEELSKADRDEIKRLASAEARKVNREFKKEVKDMVEEELERLLKKPATKDQLGEISKKILKKLYKDLSIQHPYIIDRIKI